MLLSDATHRSADHPTRTVACTSAPTPIVVPRVLGADGLQLCTPVSGTGVRLSSALQLDPRQLDNLSTTVP